MLRNEHSLGPGFFNLPEDPVAANTLIPGFRAATTVRGAFGWFTVGWIERLAPGLAVHLNRQETRPMNFTVAPALFWKERSAIDRAMRMSADEAAALIAEVFVKGRVNASALARHALDCLAWMIAEKRLLLRIAVPKPESNYHPKLWLFDDGVDQVLVRGSGNATGRGVAVGVEHVDVDVSWIPESRRRVMKGVAMLDAWASGESAGIEEVIGLPEALARDIIRTSPDKPPDPRDYQTAVRYNTPLRGPFQALPNQLTIPGTLKWREGRYAHQGEAVTAWEGGDAPETGVIAMATGAGKTITALICATRAQDRLNGRPFLIVVSAPSVPIVMQWRDEVRKFGVTPVAPTLEADTDQALTRLFRGLQGDGTHVAIVTNNLLCSTRFQETVATRLRILQQTAATMLIADEAHTLGAKSFIQNKPHMFKKRLALSATPERQYDPDGTEELFEFFGPTVYEFGLERAIGFCLVPYSYFVHVSTLSDDELEEFALLTRKIGMALAAEEFDEDNDSLQALVIARRRIIETGRSKIDLLREVLLRRGTQGLSHALIYASAKNPSQFAQIAKLLTSLRVRWAAVTQQTTGNPKRLKRILDSFADGASQVVLAKKVLDEGIDIPSIREAFIVASSTIEREWVQRRGRVLRRHPGKPSARVHDFLALPPVDTVRGDSSQRLKKIVATELDRAFSFGKFASNVAGTHGVHADIERITRAYWPASSTDQYILNGPNQKILAGSIDRSRQW